MQNIGPLELLFILLLYVLPAWLVARYAARNGQSFRLFLLLGLFTSWIVSLIIAMIVSKKPVGAA